MSRPIWKAFAVAGALAVASAGFAEPADAGRRGGGAAAAAVIGLGVGALIGGAIASDPYDYERGYDDGRYDAYHEPRRRYRYAPARYGPPPRSPDWYAYCHSRYASFDPRSGTFLAYDGRRYFCR